MDKRRGNLLSSFLLLSGAVVLLFAEFTPWVSQQYSPWYFYEINGMGWNGILYIFPIISAVIVIIIGILLNIFKDINKKLLSFIIFFALSLFLLFLFEMYSESGDFLYNSLGIFFGMGGFTVIFFGLFWMLSLETPELNS